MQKDRVNNGALTSLKYLPIAVWSELRFVLSDMTVDIVADARIMVQRQIRPQRGLSVCVRAWVYVCEWAIFQLSLWNFH